MTYYVQIISMKSSPCTNSIVTQLMPMPIAIVILEFNNISYYNAIFLLYRIALHLQRSFLLTWSICSSILSDVPRNLFGSGPIICISCGTSWPLICVKRANDFMHAYSCSSAGLPLKYCNNAIVNSTATSSNTYAFHKTKDD